MEEYLKKYHKLDISNILITGKSMISLNFDLSNLCKENEKLFNQIKYSFDIELIKWKKAAMNIVIQLVQTDSVQLPNKKIDVEFEFFNHPKRIDWPRITTDLNQLVEFKGYVFRSSTPKKLELLREVKCSKCKQKTMIKADRLYDYAFKCARKCIIKDSCDGKMMYTKKEEEIPPLENTIDFQVFKVQELDKFTPKNCYYSVEVGNKLVDACSIGDTVYILGTFETRNDLQTKEIKRVVIRAVNITKTFEFKQSINDDEKEVTHSAWIACKRRNNDDELIARDEMAAAVAPELKKCNILKFALLIVLCSGGKSKICKTRTQQLERMTNRDISHLLFIGLPGLGKSQILKAASKISNRAIKCVGSACTLAGLTASSYREEKESHVEAGALVLANHGICCIDEFNLLSTRCRDALHDSMEHQKFSFMQANLKVEINARCTVIACMNHKADQTAEARNKNIKNAAFNIEPSLISRFDLVFFLEKPEDPDFDDDIIESIISESKTEYQQAITEWTLEKLQLHIIGAKNLSCELSPDSLKLIFNYYRFCKACQEIDESRKTMRLLKSLERLTIAHAKLLFRKKTKLIDALTVIWLMENSWSFGDLISQENVVLSELPLGPTQPCIRHIFETLLLPELYERFEAEQMEITDDSLSALTFNSTIREDSQVGDKKQVKKLFNKTVGVKKARNEAKKSFVDEELPEALRQSFSINNIDDLFDDDMDSPKVKNVLDTEDLMEDFILNNQMDMNESLEFIIPNGNMSTQNQPSTSKACGSKDVIKKPSLCDLLVPKDGNLKRKKVCSDDEDLFKIFTDDIVEEVPKKLPNLIEDSQLKKKTTLGCLGRLRTFEYQTQVSQKIQANLNGNDTVISSAINENLLALSNQLAGSGTNKEVTKKNISSTMTREEISKALDDEFDLWN